MIDIRDIEAKGSELKKAILETGKIKQIIIVNRHGIYDERAVTFYKSVKETFDIVRNIFWDNYQNIGMNLKVLLDRKEKFDSEKNVQLLVKDFEITKPPFYEDDIMISFAYDEHSQYAKYKLGMPEILEEIIFQEKDKFFNLRCDEYLSLLDLLDSENIQSQINKEELYKFIHDWHIIMKIHVPNLDTFGFLKY